MKTGFFCFNRQVIIWPIGKTPLIVKNLHEFLEVADLDSNFFSVSESFTSYLAQQTLPIRVLFL